MESELRHKDWTWACRGESKTKREVHKYIKGSESFLRTWMSDCGKGWLEEALVTPKRSSSYSPRATQISIQINSAVSALAAGQNLLRGFKWYTRPIKAGYLSKGPRHSFLVYFLSSQSGSNVQPDWDPLSKWTRCPCTENIDKGNSWALFQPDDSSCPPPVKTL